MDRSYLKLPNLIFGFHGCDKGIAEAVIRGNSELKMSENTYDWLGNGIYFWENSYSRALDWANNNPNLVNDPAVIGAVIDLGNCLNLTDYGSTQILKSGYEILKLKCALNDTPLPVNRGKTSKGDYLLRDLDCAVIQQIHEARSEEGEAEYDSVRGVFLEGGHTYKGSGFFEKTHIQLCIRNPNCIKGYFLPKMYNDAFSMP